MLVRCIALCPLVLAYIFYYSALLSLGHYSQALSGQQQPMSGTVSPIVPHRACPPERLNAEVVGLRMRPSLRQVACGSLAA